MTISIHELAVFLKDNVNKKESIELHLQMTKTYIYIYNKFDSPKGNKMGMQIHVCKTCHLHDIIIDIEQEEERIMLGNNTTN